MAHEEARDEAEAKSPYGAVESVRHGGAEARDESQGAAFRERAAYDEHPDGAHGGGDGETDGDTAYEKFHDHVRILLKSRNEKPPVGRRFRVKSARERASRTSGLSVGLLLEMEETVNHGNLCFASRYPKLCRSGVKRSRVSAR